MATYRQLQSDFSAGQLDPMTVSNLNNNLRSIGLETSRNTLHYQNGTVGKRPPFKDCCITFADAPNQEYHDTFRQHSVTMQIDGYTLIAEITWNFTIADTLNIVWKGSPYRNIPIEIEDGTTITKGTSTLGVTIKSICAYKEFILILFNVETNTSPSEEYSVIQTIKVVEDSSRTCGLKFVVVSDANTIDGENYPGWKSDSIYSCMYLAGGRLILAEDNGLFLSRTRTLALMESEDSGAPLWLYDFTLADYSYIFTAKRTGGTITVDGLSATVEETFECESSEDPGDTITLEQAKEWQSKRTTKFTIDGGWPVTDTSEASKTVVTYIENGYSGSGVVSFSSVRTVDNVEYLTTPDEAPSPDQVTWEADTLTVDTDELVESPTVYDTHGIELHENDMYSSRILWISYIGRVIVGTDQAIFIATSQSITPELFDLVIAANIGTSEIQPQVMNNLIIFTSADRKKLYAGIYSDELQGMQFTEASSSARDLFIGLISRFWILEYPFMMIYVVTEDGRLLVCTPTSTDSGYNFAWSEWTFLPDRTRQNALYITKVFHDRGNSLASDTDLKTPRIFMLASGYKASYLKSDISSPSYPYYQLLELLYTEPYEYGLTDDVKWQFDAKLEGVIGYNKYGMKVSVYSAYSSIMSSEEQYNCIIKWNTETFYGATPTQAYKSLSPVAIFGGLFIRNLYSYFTTSTDYGYSESTLDKFSLNVGLATGSKLYFRITLSAQSVNVSYADFTLPLYFRLGRSTSSNTYVGDLIELDATFEDGVLTISEQTISLVFDRPSTSSNYYLYPGLYEPTSGFSIRSTFKGSKALVLNLTDSVLSVLSQTGFSTDEKVKEFFDTYCSVHPMEDGSSDVYIGGRMDDKTETSLQNNYWYAMFALYGVTDEDEIAEIVDSVEYSFGGYYFPSERYADVFDASLSNMQSLVLYPPSGQGSLFNSDYEDDATFTATIGVPYEMRIGLIQQLLPNNSGTALRSKHSIDKIQLQVFRSFGGSIYAQSELVKDLLYLMYGKDSYSTGGIDPNTQLPYCFTGIVSVDNPVQNTEDDEIEIISDTPYPFNLMAVSIKYNITEIN